MSLIYPRPTKTPFKPAEVQGRTGGYAAGKAAGCLAACCLSGFLVSVFFAVQLNSDDHFVMFAIGAGIPFLTSLPFLWK